VSTSCSVLIVERFAFGDDLNNTEDVESEADRETVKEFWQEFHSTRLNSPNDSAIIVIQRGYTKMMYPDSSSNQTKIGFISVSPMRYDTSR